MDYSDLKMQVGELLQLQPRTGTIVDMSTAGALMVAAQPLGEAGEEVTVGCALKMGGTEKLLSLPAKIRSGHREPGAEHGEGSYYHGLEFGARDRQDTFMLHGFVYGQIVKTQSEQRRRHPHRLPRLSWPGYPGISRRPARPCSPSRRK